MPEDMEKRVAQYIALRDKRQALDDEYKTKRAIVTDMMDKLEGVIHAFLTENGIENIRTKAGTCYRSVSYTASVQDKDAFMNFVKEGHWDLIERRANKIAVKDYVEKYNHLPAGVNLTSVATVGVRRPTATK